MSNSEVKKIFIGADHAGFEYKEAIKEALAEDGYDVEDKGAFTYDAQDDYSDFIYPVAVEVAKDPENIRGIVLGGSGEGEAFMANKVKGIRAVIGFSEFVIIASREHNDGNILSLGARTISKEDAIKFVKLWLKTPFSDDERHIRRINKIKKIEEELYK